MIDSAIILAILALVVANAARGLRSAISTRCGRVATLNGRAKPMFVHAAEHRRRLVREHVNCAPLK